MAQIVPVEKLEAKIRTSKDIVELKDIHDKAEAIRVYVGKYEKNFTKQNKYAELKIRAERRCGEILATEIQHGGDQKSKSRFDRKTLKDLGISKNQSHRWQTIAHLTEEAFEGHIAKIKDSKKELTSAGVYRIANEYRRALKAEAEPVPGSETIKTPISIKTITGDFMDHIDKFKNVDAIITDPPYSKEYLHQYENLARFASKVLKPGGSLLTMAGVYYLPQVFELMTPHLKYHWTISYHMPRRPRRDWNKKIFNTWKPILWFVKDKYEGKWNKDVLEAGEIEKTFHPWQQTVADFEAFIEMVSKSGETIIDPFFGWGTLGEAAIKLNREFEGIEIDPNTMQTAEKRLESFAKKIVLPSHYSDDNSDTQKKAKKQSVGRRFSSWDKEKIQTEDGTEIEATAPIVISASRSTDLPGVYSDWFIERLRRGYLVKRQPRNTKIIEHISFSKTRLIVFWTKNPKPMFKYLDEIKQMGIGYYFQYTVNDYEKENYEPNLPPLQKRIDYFKSLSGKIGKERVVWRFDPLILTDQISRENLVEKVHNIMCQLTGYTEKLVISFLKKAGIKYRVFSEDDKNYVAKHLGDMGKEFGIEVATCAEEDDLRSYDIRRNKCIDDALIRKVFSKDTALMEFIGDGKGLEHKLRPGCDCIVSKDIGERNTCLHLCKYCYANDSENAVKENFKRISRTGEMLLPDLPN